MSVIRLLIGVLCALGLAIAPAGATTMSSDVMVGCTMGKQMPKKAAEHEKMDCCTPTCQVPAASALLPVTLAAAKASGHSTMKLAWALAKELTSFRNSGLDPPPRG